MGCVLCAHHARPHVCGTREAVSCAEHHSREQGRLPSPSPPLHTHYSPVLGRLKSSDTERLQWMRRMASAMRGATESCISFSLVSRWGLSGTVLQVTTSSKHDWRMRSEAGPEKRPWDAKANTRRAPCSLSDSAAWHRVPAVSIMSSTMMASLSLTVPTRSMRSISPGRERCLIIMASPGSSSESSAKPSRNFLALYTPPASGDTMTGLWSFFLRKYLTPTVPPSRLSTGTRGPKKPWI
mmetsp:Transcript_1343/g.3957  ORF Transcript_1343/g.3957 Transcript_1343/m.3957 type:complete len:239 (+) Transcript_1343:1144-1860(+)